MGDGDFRSTERSVTIGARRTSCASSSCPPRATSSPLVPSLPVQAGRDRRRRGDAPARAGRLPRAAGRRGARAGRAVLRAPEGDDDEGLRPDHLRPRRAGVLRRRLRVVRRRRWHRSARARTTGWRASSPRSRSCPRSERRRIEEAIEAAYASGPRARDGRLRPRDHQPARAERRHHRRVDAGDDPHLGPDVERRRRPAGRQGRDPGLQLRGAVRGDDRLLPRARRLRPGDHGHDAERRADGAEGGGVRLARQDVRDPGGRRACGSSTRRARSCSAHDVEAGDIWRACQTKAAPVADWVRAGDRPRAGDGRARGVLARRDARARRRGPAEACARSCPRTTSRGCASRCCRSPRRPASRSTRAAAGEDTIAATGNVLRDYLTDLFPILELGTSAKMLSIVPLMNGGGLFETGAGGSAPKHVQQLVRENHLRWDSLGEFLALAVSFEMLADKTGNARAGVLAKTLDEATGALLENGRSPSRKVGRAGQPRLALLPRAVLGAGAGRAVRRRGAARRVRRPRRAARGRRGHDRRAS